jgi:very-short-patch-repair endonuclease
MLLRAVPLSRVQLARYLRRTMSGVEWNLWSCLRGKQLDGFRFRRKALVGPYIVDFACLSARLVVELGGEMYDGHRLGDDGRDEWLAARGFCVVRFTNADVAEHLDQVLARIRAELAGRPRRVTPVGPEPGSFRGRRFRRYRPAARGP